MDFQVLITDAAVADLQQIVAFVAEDDPAAAQRLGAKLIAAGLSLRKMPERFPIHDSARGLHKMSLPPYLIFYRCDSAVSAVYILHFWHGARRPPRFGR
jgi:plasmid stabilization system protein ParE